MSSKPSSPTNVTNSDGDGAGTVPFAIDASSLSAGQHTLLVRVLCANGSVGEIVYPVTAGDNAGEVTGGPNGPDLTFRSPSNGRRVMGRVELTVGDATLDFTPEQVRDIIASRSASLLSARRFRFRMTFSI